MGVRGRAASCGATSLTEMPFSDVLEMMSGGPLSPDAVWFSAAASVAKYVAARECPDGDGVRDRGATTYFGYCERRGDGLRTVGRGRIFALSTASGDVRAASDTVDGAFYSCVDSPFEWRRDIGRDIAPSGLERKFDRGGLKGYKDFTTAPTHAPIAQPGRALPW